MTLWPRSLRWRLTIAIVGITLVMQAALLVGISSIFDREQGSERALQLARMLVFVAERSGSLQASPVGEGAHTILPLPTRPASAVGQSSSQAGFENGALPNAFVLRQDVTNTKSIANAQLEKLFSVYVQNDSPVLADLTDGDQELLQAMQAIVPSVFHVQYRKTGKWYNRGPNQPYEIEAWVRLRDDRYAKITHANSWASGEVMPASRLLLGASIELGVRILVVVVLALLVTAWLVKPIQAVQHAADEAMPDDQTLPSKAISLPTDAPTEVANAIAAFERMRARIGGMVAERTNMLMSLAHDLRTPITRLSLRLEMSSDDRIRDEAMQDLEKMQTLINSTLEYLRSTDSSHHVESVPLRSALMQIVEDLGEPYAANVTIVGDDWAVYAASWAVNRIVTNLIENAVRYGHRAQVVVMRDEQQRHMVSLRVADYGAGVPETFLARLREPFFRVDPARNLDAGGPGLGLSIVDNLARAYGGSMQVQNASPSIERDQDMPTGLIVTVKLPMAVDSSNA